MPYFAETYDNLPRILGDATPKLLAIADGQTASEVNASLRKGFIITGTVTDQTTDTPISGVNVHAVQGDGTGSYFGPTARTLGNGRYTLGPLEANQYRLFIES